MGAQTGPLRAGAVVAAAAFALAACGDIAPDSADPDKARCDDPLVVFGAVTHQLDHLEVGVRFTCAGAVQSGTVYLPLSNGPHRGAVWVFGNGPQTRLRYSAPIVSSLVQAGVAVLSYDKRGVGESHGVCCPGDHQHFNLLAADAAGAVNALRAVPGIDTRRVGLIGASQAGWVAAVAAARSRNIAFIGIADGPTVSNGEELLFSLLTGEEGSGGGVLSDRAIKYRLRQAGPSGFDPLPFLRQIRVPMLWLYGLRDRSIPVDECIAVLTRLHSGGADIAVETFPTAGHGLLDNPPSDPDALPDLVKWVRDMP